MVRTEDSRSRWEGPRESPPLPEPQFAHLSNGDLSSPVLHPGGIGGWCASAQWVGSGRSQSVPKHSAQKSHAVHLMLSAFMSLAFKLLLCSVLKVYLFLFYMYECFACMHVCAPRMCLVPMKFRRGRHVPWNWSYRRDVELWPARRRWELKHQAVSPAPGLLFYLFSSAFPNSQHWGLEIKIKVSEGLGVF